MASHISLGKTIAKKPTGRRKVCPVCGKTRNLNSFLTTSNHVTGVCRYCRDEASKNRILTDRTTLSAIPLSTLVKCECCPIGSPPIPLREMNKHMKKHNREFCEVIRS